MIMNLPSSTFILLLVREPVLRKGVKFWSWYHPRVRKDLSVPQYGVLCAESGKVGCVRNFGGPDPKKGGFWKKSENPIRISV